MSEKIWIQNKSPKGNDPVRSLAQESEAINLLKSGNALLSTGQKEPPGKLLKYMEGNVSNRARFGPESNTEEILSKISRELFANGVRQRVVEGKGVRWFKSGREFLSATRACLFECANERTDLLQQAGSALKSYVSNRAGRVTLSYIPSEAEMQIRCWVRGRSGNFMYGTRDYYQLSAAWFDYHERIEALRATLGDTIRASLREGRIIASEGSDRACLIHPDEATDLAFGSRKSPLWFCFSSSLPSSWLPSTSPLPSRKKRARAWMVRTFSHFEHAGRRANIKDLKAVAMEKFDLTENAAKMVRAEIGSGIRVGRGQPAAGKEVDINEIRELE